jgi:hypothetical protein
MYWKIFVRFLILFCLSPALAKNADRDCVIWFEKSKIKTESKDCELICATLMTDMSTFVCPDQCDRLCKIKQKFPESGKFVYYPGLTQAERALVEKYPKDAIKVFIQKNRAEWSSDRNFPTQQLNDEGDAFRHFVWAGLLTNELGKDRALEFLNAHEENRLQPVDERDMDLANNQSGIRSAESLIKSKNFSLKNLEQRALEDLHEKRLHVLTPGLPIPKEPL